MAKEKDLTDSSNSESKEKSSRKGSKDSSTIGISDNVKRKSSYEKTMKMVMEKPYDPPVFKVKSVSSREQARNMVLKTSLSDADMESEGVYNDTGQDFNTVAEISYEESDKKSNANREIHNSVSWKAVSEDIRYTNSTTKSKSDIGPSILRKGSKVAGTSIGDMPTNGRSKEPISKKGVESTNMTSKDNFIDEPIEEDESLISHFTEWCCFYPKVDPLPFATFLALTFYAAIPAVLYILAFTKIGYGLKVFSFIDTHVERYAHYLGGITAVFAMCLYLLDIYYWSSYLGVLCRRICIGILTVFFFSFIFALSSDHPYGPIGIVLVATTSWMVAVRFICYRHVAQKVYISWLSGPLVTVSQCVAIYWLCWTLAREENEWNVINNLASAESVGCLPNFDEYPQCDLDGYGEVCFTVYPDEATIEFEKDCEEICIQVYDSCLNSFIVWGGPFLVSVGFFFLSFVASFLRGDGTAEQNAVKLAHSWMFLLFGMWISSCMAGAGTGVSTTLTALTFSAFAASAIFMLGGYTAYEREERLLSLWERIVEKYGSMLDACRGLLIITSTPVGLIYIFIAFVRQSLRNLNFCCSTPPVDTKSLQYIGGVGWLTVESRRFIRTVKSWDRVKVITYAIYWGIAFMILSVIVAEFSILFLSYTIEKTSDMNIAIVTGILSLVGMIMFLLPPVPGVPIYLTLGIVIVPVGRESFGIVGSIMYALVISLCLKLLACTLQQKMIGGLLKHKVGVRQFVGINTPLIRSMKLVLREKGFSIAKVAILIGGPDWPTSVLCGIMDLPLIPILIGTLPIILLITPTLLTGALTYMSSLKIEETGQLEFPWAATVGTVCAALTGIVQFGSMVVAAYFVERAISTRTEELEALPIDEEVKMADDKLEEEQKAYSEVTQWHRVPIFAKVILYLSLICMILSCYMVQLFSDDCFTEYQLTYTIDQHLDGKWTNIVKPLGLIALILFSISIVLLQSFVFWAKRKAKSGGIPVYPEPSYPETTGHYSHKGNNIVDPTTNYIQVP